MKSEYYHYFIFTKDMCLFIKKNILTGKKGQSIMIQRVTKIKLVSIGQIFKVLY